MFLATNGIISSSQTQPNILLPGDYSTGAHVAYSLRKVVAAYTGPVARIRRSSDNTAQDFTADEITNGTMLAFVGAGDGFVNILYNQTALTSRDLSQGNAINQPIIVEAGVIYTENTKPSMKFDGNRFLLNNTASNWVFLHYHPSSVFSVQKVTGANPNTLYAIWATGQSISGTRVAYLRYDDRAASGFNNDWIHVIGNSGIVVLNSMAAGTGQFVTDKLLTARVHASPRNPTISSRSFVGIDSNTLANNNAGTASSTTSNPTHGLRLGDANNGWRLVGAISEVIIYYDGIANMIGFDSQIDDEMKTYYSIT